MAAAAAASLGLTPDAGWLAAAEAAGGGWLAWHTVGRVSCSRPERGGGGQSARRCGGERVRVREYVVGGEVGREGDGGVARRQDASVQNHTHTLPFHRPFTTAPSPAATCCRWTKSSTRGRRPSSGECGERERWVGAWAKHDTHTQSSHTPLSLSTPSYANAGGAGRLLKLLLTDGEALSVRERR